MTSKQEKALVDQVDQPVCRLWIATFERYEPSDLVQFGRRCGGKKVLHNQVNTLVSCPPLGIG